MKKVKSKMSYWLIAAGYLALFGIASCSKSNNNNNNPPPPVLIGGYASSDSVASANLIAYWPFDANANDTKGGLTATAVGSGVTFTSAGVRGNAYQGVQGAYFTLPVPSGSPFNNIGSYSESFWYKVAAQDTLTQGMFFMSGTTDQGELITEIEPFKPVSGDSIRIHTGFDDLNSPTNFKYFVPETFDTAAIGKWVYMTVTYNGGTSTYTVYQNAIPMKTSSAFSNGGYITPNMFFTESPGVNPLGNIGFTSDPPTVINIGSWPDGMFGIVAANNCFIGQMDELRIFNKALTQTEVSGLFLNGQAGR
jgi:Concanavalin A-like lectin/glucanases superfamily